MSGLLHIVECPICQRTAQAHELLDEWDETAGTYSAKCGHHFHLDAAQGGARNWLQEGE